MKEESFHLYKKVKWKFILPLTFVLIICYRFTPVIAQTITCDPWQKFSIPALMPSGVMLQKSNNNLDLIRFKERYYVAFRTAPTHFASTKTCLYIVSSTDFKTWDFEYSIQLKSDVREPRFASWKDSLYLYFFQGGKRTFKFEPKQLLVVGTAGNKVWTSSQSLNLDGYVPWRLRQNDGKLLLSAYYGKDLYNSKHQSDLRLFESADARHFTPITQQPQINLATAEEGEFIFDTAGTLYAVVRLEGYGALICKAEKDSIEFWKMVRSKYKYDSSLLFEHNNEIYLIARRNLDGPCDRATDGKKSHRRYNLVRYSLTKKRTALFHLEKETLSLTHVLDLKSTGDCSFAGIQKINATDYLVMNYSSNIDKKEKIWLRGQFGNTYIYWSVIHIN